MSVELAPNQRVALIVDGGTSVTSDHHMVKDVGISVVPIGLAFGDQPFPFSAPLNNFYAELKTNPKPPITSAPSFFEYITTTDELVGHNPSLDSVVITTISTHLSGTFKQALLAAEQISDEKFQYAHHIEAIAIDTKNISIAALFPALAGAELARLGAPRDEVVDVVKDTIPRVDIVTVFEQMNLFKQGGRANQILNSINAQLVAHPIITVTDEGRVGLRGWSRGKSFDAARNKMVEIVLDAGPLKRVAIVHTNAPSKGNALADALRAKGYTGTIDVEDGRGPIAAHANENATAIIYERA